MTNPPSITSRKVDQEEIIVFTWPNKLIYLHTIIITENVNIGMILKKMFDLRFELGIFLNLLKMAKLCQGIESI